ncbi:MAG: type II toxin-antitoxin system VapC family toxin [Cyanobacteria bacterium P01_F01_bin.143]
MKFLLDTHTFIWYVTNNRKLSLKAQELINDGNNEILLSIVSIWEMVIKHSVGKLGFELPFELFIKRQLAINDFQLLNIKVENLFIVANLPLHHRNPFDRLMIAQAMVEEIPIVGTDEIFDSYPIKRLW